jgi:hypothetical protein
MRRAGILLTGLMIVMQAAPTRSEGAPPLRYGNTSGWFYDGRSDHRDVPTNGYFPGNFAADRPGVVARPLFAPWPERSTMPYPSQVAFGGHSNRKPAGKRKER